MNYPPNHAGNRGTTHIFFKTRLCMKFMEGECRNGDSCTFAHGMADMREPPPNWQELVKEKDRGGSSGNWADDNKFVNRMKICRKFYYGEECPYGDKCNFLHEAPLKYRGETGGRSRESSAISIGTTGGQVMGFRNGSDQPDSHKIMNGISDSFQMKPEFWKTKLCIKWETTGYCPFGERCHFAHGHSELKLSSSRTEAETTVNGNSIPVKPQSVVSNDAAAPSVPKVGESGPDGENKKGFAKWKRPRKINCIYGDWIDDFTSPHSLPSQV